MTTAKNKGVKSPVNWSRIKTMIVACCAMMLPAAQAAEFVVLTDLDASGGAVIDQIGPDVYTIGTLRSAIEQANDEINFPGPDLIRFDEALITSNPGSDITIILGLVGGQFVYQTQSSDSALVVSSAIQITGFAAGSGLPTIRLEADNQRHFQVNPGGSLRLRNLTLREGVTPQNSAGRGGAVVVSENARLEVNDCQFSFNEAVNGGALAFQSGALDSLILHSDFSFNTASDDNVGTTELGLGGAIFADSNTTTLTIERSEFNFNVANAHGGAVFTEQPTEIMASAFYRNDAELDGGGLFAGSNAQLMISNAVFFDNSARLHGGALYTMAATNQTGLMLNTTIAKNDAGFDLFAAERGLNSTAGGGVFTAVDNNLVLHNSIVADNRDAGTNDDVMGALAASSSHNLIGVDGAMSGISHNNQGNLIGTVAQPIDAKLQLNALLTLVIGLESNSPAINSGSDAQVINANLDTDFNGNDRIIGPAVDRGAFETDVLFYNGFD